MCASLDKKAGSTPTIRPKNKAVGSLGIEVINLLSLHTFVTVVILIYFCYG